MRRYIPALVPGLVGAALLRVAAFSDLYLRYVKPGLRPMLVVSGVVLLLVAVVAAVQQRRGGRSEEHAGHAHSGGIMPLLAVPALLLLVYAPPSLGSYTVARDGSGQIAKRVDFPALPATGAVPLTLSDFQSRAVWDDHQSLKGRTVELMGFVTPRGNGGWQLGRVLVTCCAADARVLAVDVYGLPAPPAGTWVTVTGVWNPRHSTPSIDASTLSRIPTPQNPYRDTAP